MTKATAWANNPKSRWRDRPQFRLHRLIWWGRWTSHPLVADVLRDGRLRTVAREDLTAQEALDLARWIRETFDESPT